MTIRGEHGTVYAGARAIAEATQWELKLNDPVDPPYAIMHPGDVSGIRAGALKDEPEQAKFAPGEPVPGSFYDEDYYTSGTKSNYAPYGPGTWADWIVDMVMEYTDPHPLSVLDAGCAYGFLVERFWNKRGIPAWGFDVSSYAIQEQGYWSRTWVGDCTDPSAWRLVDLAICTEVGEHLTPDQSRKLLENGHQFSERFLLLIAVDLGEGDPTDHPETDGSHINVVPMSWWEQLAREVGWTVSDASAFNDDWRSSQMGWQGRWILLTKEV